MSVIETDRKKKKTKDMKAPQSLKVNMTLTNLNTHGYNCYVFPILKISI